MFVFFQRKIVLLFHSSNMAAMNTVFNKKRNASMTEVNINQAVTFFMSFKSEFKRATIIKL